MVGGCYCITCGYLVLAGVLLWVRWYTVLVCMFICGVLTVWFSGLGGRLVCCWLFVCVDVLFGYVLFVYWYVNSVVLH